jgi:hypothetical protein
VIKAATLCEDEGSDSPPVLVQKEDRQFLSPFQEKVGDSAVRMNLMHYSASV